METQQLKPSFSNIQLELLKLYTNGVPDEQLIEIRWMLGKYFAGKATSAMDALIETKGLTPDDILRQSKEHHRSESRS